NQCDNPRMRIAEHATNLFDRSKAGKPICITQPPLLRRSNQNPSPDAADTSPAKSSPIRVRNPSAGQIPKTPLSPGRSRLNLHDIHPHDFTKTTFCLSMILSETRSPLFPIMLYFCVPP